MSRYQLASLATPLTLTPAEQTLLTVLEGHGVADALALVLAAKHDNITDVFHELSDQAQRAARTAGEPVSLPLGFALAELHARSSRITASGIEPHHWSHWFRALPDGNGRWYVQREPDSVQVVLPTGQPSGSRYHAEHYAVHLNQAETARRRAEWAVQASAHTIVPPEAAKPSEAASEPAEVTTHE